MVFCIIYLLYILSTGINTINYKDYSIDFIKVVQRF